MDQSVGKRDKNPDVKTEEGDIVDDLQLVPNNIIDTSSVKAEVKPESCSIGTQTEDLYYQCGERFVMRFKNFPSGTKEEDILKFIYSALEPGEIIYISIPYQKAHVLYGHGYVIVKTEKASEKFLRLNGLKVKGSSIEVYKGALKTANKKNKGLKRKLNDDRPDLIQLASKRSRFDSFGYGGATSAVKNNFMPPLELQLDSDSDSDSGVEFLGYGIKEEKFEKITTVP